MLNVCVFYKLQHNSSCKRLKAKGLPICEKKVGGVWEWIS